MRRALNNKWAGVFYSLMSQVAMYTTYTPLMSGAGLGQMGNGTIQYVVKNTHT